MKYNVGARIGNVVFVWKVPLTIDQTEQHKTVIKVKETIPQFETRAIEKEIREKYSRSTGISPVLRRSLVQFVTGEIPN